MNGFDGQQGPPGFDGVVGEKGKLFIIHKVLIASKRILKGYPGLDGTYGRDGDKGFKGSKGERSDTTPFCTGEKGEAGTIVFFSRRNATTVIKGGKGKKGDKGPRGEDGSHGRTGSPGAPGYRGTKGEKKIRLIIQIDLEKRFSYQ